MLHSLGFDDSTTTFVGIPISKLATCQELMISINQSINFKVAEVHKPLQGP